MRVSIKICILLLLVILALVPGYNTVTTCTQLQKNKKTDIKLKSKYIKGSGIDEHLRIPFTIEKSANVRQTQIIVEYNGFTPKAKEAFEHAVQNWAKLIYSPQPIYINATWENLGTNVLGSCNASRYVYDLAELPDPNKKYPIALAEKLTNKAINEPGEPDINANFSSVANWYLETDGNTPSGKYDLVSVVMHEICHGLGFTSSFYIDEDNIGSWGYGENVPFVFDQFVYTNLDEQLIDTSKFNNNSEGLKIKLTSGKTYFKGKAASSFDPSIELYSPMTWDNGSSISHLGEKYNGTTNALMTYSIGSASSVHHPGNVTLGIMADIGWQQLYIEHEPKAIVEDISDLTLKTKMFTDFDEDVKSSILIYSKDGNSADTVSFVLNSTLDSSYIATIPIEHASNIEYHIEAQDIYGRVFREPMLHIKNKIETYVGFDTVAPTIVHNPILLADPINDTILFSAEVEDKIGIDSVFIEYFINNTKQENILLSLLDNEYYGTIKNTSTLTEGDSIQYRLVAKDKSIAGNFGYTPSSGFYTIAIREIPDFINSYSNNFNSGSNDFILNEFQITSYQNFNSPALHTLHPYETAKDGNRLNYTAELSLPIKINGSNPLITFDEVVLVEPGKEGIGFGQMQFYDYVVVEGSKDKGQTWTEFTEGWDSRYKLEWETLYKRIITTEGSSTAKGTESLLFNRSINMTESPAFNDGDTIKIRFRLFSDSENNGWGWCIDNIEIQAIPTFAEAPKLLDKPYKLFPNPIVSGNPLYIEKNHSDAIDKLSLISSIGQIVYSKSAIESNNLSLPKLQPGLYLVVIENDEKIYPHKLIVK